MGFEKRASDTALDQDLRACRDPDAIGALLTNLRQDRPVLRAQSTDFGGTLNDKSALLAAYVACMNRGILDFFTGAKVLLQGAVDRHHILPRAQFPQKERARSDNIANIAFIASDVNKAMGLTGPGVYLKAITQAILESQCVPTDERLWSIERSEDFWTARRELLADSFNDFVRKVLPQRRIT